MDASWDEEDDDDDDEDGPVIPPPREQPIPYAKMNRALDAAITKVQRLKKQNKRLKERAEIFEEIMWRLKRNIRKLRKERRGKVKRK